jgi:hypothetical protein
LEWKAGELVLLTRKILSMCLCKVHEWPNFTETCEHCAKPGDQKQHAVLRRFMSCQSAQRSSRLIHNESVRATESRAQYCVEVSRPVDWRWVVPSP